jgi:hypothetical protein
VLVIGRFDGLKQPCNLPIVAFGRGIDGLLSDIIPKYEDRIIGVHEVDTLLACDFWLLPKAVEIQPQHVNKLSTDGFRDGVGGVKGRFNDC